MPHTDKDFHKAPLVVVWGNGSNKILGWSQTEACHPERVDRTIELLRPELQRPEETTGTTSSFPDEEIEPRDGEARAL